MDRRCRGDFQQLLRGEPRMRFAHQLIAGTKTNLMGDRDCERSRAIES